jgi:RNA polymerase sigma-70 factor (ECF subfamily)
MFRSESLPFVVSSGLKSSSRVQQSEGKREKRPPAADGELIRRAKKGDIQAFEELYNLHRRRVFSLCLRVVGDISQAEDLTQEAFLQVYRKLHTFRGDSAFSTWLHRLALNVALMHLRKKMVRTTSIEEALTTSNEEPVERQFGNEDRRLRHSITRIELERAIRELPPGYRLIFILHDVEGYEHREIAEMLGCSIGNSKSQLHKARIRLLNLLRRAAVTQEAA